MRIVALQAENIKKLVAVEIRPDGNIVEITGRNGQGKTSVLDCIWWALAGATHIQSTPIRKGESTARIRLDLGEIIVTRTFKAGKDGEATSAISVETANGARFSSPQAMLDELLGQLSFDPLAFSRMDARSQFNTLRQFVPGVDFEAIDRKNEGDYARRTEINRQIKSTRVRAESLMIPPGIPKEIVDESTLIQEYEKGAKHNADIEVRLNNRDQYTRKMNELRGQAETLMREAAEIQHKLESAATLPAPIDLSALHNQIADAKRINQWVTANKQKSELIETAKALESEEKALTASMAKRNAEKMAAISAAKLPVQGIGFGDNMILLNGVPFDQASDAEQLRASIAIAMALNPKLKVIRVRDGSLLDSDSMEILAEMAADKDYQVWVERVDSSGKVGFVLENGYVKQEVKSVA